MYLITLNGIVVIKDARSCYNQNIEAVPSRTLLRLIDVFTAEFVRLISKHKKRIIHTHAE